MHLVTHRARFEIEHFNTVRYIVSVILLLLSRLNSIGGSLKGWVSTKYSEMYFSKGERDDHFFSRNGIYWEVIFYLPFSQVANMNQIISFEVTCFQTFYKMYLFTVSLHVRTSMRTLYDCHDIYEQKFSYWSVKRVVFRGCFSLLTKWVLVIKLMTSHFAVSAFIFEISSQPLNYYWFVIYSNRTDIIHVF